MSLFLNKYRIESTRLQNWDYSLPGIYFITLCTQSQIPWFGKVIDGKMVFSDIGKFVYNEWKETGKIRSNVILDAFIVMPDHMHAIVIIKSPKNDFIGKCESVETHCDASLPETAQNIPFKNIFGPQRNNLSSIIRGYKSKTTKYIRRNINKNFKWQARFYDQIIRNERHLLNVRKYILNNPIKWNW